MKDYLYAVNFIHLQNNRTKSQSMNIRYTTLLIGLMLWGVLSAQPSMKLEKRLHKTKDYDEYCYLSEKIEVLKKIIRYQ